MKQRKIVVAITGASGSIYAKLLLRHLEKQENITSAIVWSGNAKTVWEEELDNKEFTSLPFQSYENNNFFAPFASGSAKFDTLIICPCSMGTLGRIANGNSDSLITRTADVMLKERRKLICVVRETPYNLIHIKNMETLTLSGAIICPASPSFYSKAQSVEAIAQTVVDRILNLADIPNNSFEWGE